VHHLPGQPPVRAASPVQARADVRRVQHRRAEAGAVSVPRVPRCGRADDGRLCHLNVEDAMAPEDTKSIRRGRLSFPFVERSLIEIRAQSHFFFSFFFATKSREPLNPLDFFFFFLFFFDS
jgi:hypothetical protein